MSKWAKLQEECPTIAEAIEERLQKIAQDFWNSPIDVSGVLATCGSALVPEVGANSSWWWHPVIGSPHAAKNVADIVDEVSVVNEDAWNRLGPKVLADPRLPAGVSGSGTITATQFERYVPSPAANTMTSDAFFERIQALCTNCVHCASCEIRSNLSVAYTGGFPILEPKEWTTTKGGVTICSLKRPEPVTPDEVRAAREELRGIIGL